MRRLTSSPFATAGAFLALAAAMTLQVSSAEAVVHSWFSAVNGSASNANLWSPTGAPIAADFARFTVPGTYTVTWASPQDTLSGLDIITAATPALSISGRLGVLNNFTVSNSSRVTIAAGVVGANRLRVGGAGAGRLIVSGGGSVVRTRTATAAMTFAETTSTSASVHVLAAGQILCNSWIETARKSATSCSVVVSGGNLITGVGSRFGTLGANVSGFRGDVFLSLFGTTRMDVSNGGVFDVKGNLVVGQRGVATLRMIDQSSIDPFIFVYGTTYVGYNAFDALPAAQGTMSIEGSIARLGGGLFIGDPDHTTGNSDFGKLVTRAGTTIIGGTGISMPTSLAGSIEMVGGTIQLLSGASSILQPTPFNISSGVGSPLLWVNGTADVTVTPPPSNFTALGVGRGGAGRLRLAGPSVSLTSMRNTFVADSAGGSGILEVDSSAVFTGRGNLTLGSGGQITVSNGGQLLLPPTPPEPTPDLVSSGSITLDGGTISAYLGTFNPPGVVSGRGTFTGAFWDNRTSIVIPSPDTMTFLGPFENRGTISGGGTLAFQGSIARITGVVGASMYFASSTLEAHAPDNFGKDKSQGGSVTAGGPVEAPLGRLHVQGDLTFVGNSMTFVRVGSQSDGLRDTVEVDGTASLTGDLYLTSIAGSVRAPGDTVTVLTAGNVVGTFAQIFLDLADPGDSVQVVYTPTAVKIVFGQATVGVPDEPRTDAAPIELRFAARRSHGVTAFVLDLPEAAQVRLRLYDISGREVARLADGAFEVGRHSFPLRGHALTSGMYFARVSIDAPAGRRVLTTRAALLR